MRCTFQIQISMSHALISPSSWHVNNHIIAFLIPSAVITASTRLHVLIASDFLWLRNDYLSVTDYQMHISWKKEACIISLLPFLFHSTIQVWKSITIRRNTFDIFHLLFVTFHVATLETAKRHSTFTTPWWRITFLAF